MFTNGALVFIRFIYLDDHWEDAPNMKRLEYLTARTAKPCWSQQRSATLIGVSWLLAQLWQFCGIPGWAQKKGASRGEWDFIWLPIERPPLRYLGPGSQCKTNGSAVQHSCPKLLYGKHLWGTLSLPWGYTIYVWEGSACWWCMNMPTQMWHVVIDIKVHFYILLLAKTLMGLCT